MGIEVVGESQLVGYPTQFPSVTMLDWKTGRPNARFRVLELIQRNFGPGDALVPTRIDGGSVHARGFVTRDGQRRLFLVNKRDRNATVSIAGLERAKLSCVDVATKDAIASTQLTGPTVSLGPFAVAVIDLGPR
jgi:hypothetical protein